MPLPVIADTLRVAVRGTASNGHHWANVLHYRKSTVLTFTGAIAILDPILVDHLSTNNGTGSGWNALAPTTASIQDIVYTPLDGASASTVITHAIAGANGSDGLPPSVALVVSLRTALRGRSYRGRVYTGPHIESDNSSLGAPVAALLTAESGQWAAHLTALAGTGVSLVVASYLHATAQDVTSVSVDARWDTQRRRLNA